MPVWMLGGGGGRVELGGGLCGGWPCRVVVERGGSDCVLLSMARHSPNCWRLNVVGMRLRLPWTMKNASELSALNAPLRFRIPRRTFGLKQHVAKA